MVRYEVSNAHEWRAACRQAVDGDAIWLGRNMDIVVSRAEGGPRPGVIVHAAAEGCRYRQQWLLGAGHVLPDQGVFRTPEWPAPQAPPPATDLDPDVALVRRALEGSGLTVEMGFSGPALRCPAEGIACVAVAPRDALWWRALVELARRAQRAEELRHHGAAVIDLSHLTGAEQEELRASFAQASMTPGLLSLSEAREKMRADYLEAEAERERLDRIISGSPFYGFRLEAGHSPADLAREPAPAVVLMDEIAPYPPEHFSAQSYDQFVREQLAAISTGPAKSYEMLTVDMDAAETARLANLVHEATPSPTPAPPGWPADAEGHALPPESMTPEQRLHLAISLQEAMELHHGPRCEAGDEAGRLVWFAWDMGLGMSTEEMMRALGQEVDHGI